MRENRVKRLLREGEVPLGSMVFEFSTTGLPRIAAAAGADFLVFDMEHSGWSMETVRGLLAASRAVDLTPVVRVPAGEYHFIARALDVGAMGIMVPMVETEEDARLLVRSARYPPEGRRGAAFGVAHDDYEGGDLVSKIRSANEEVLSIALVETVKGVENAERIAALPGIDVLWIGHFDLSLSMGIPGQFSHPDLQRAFDRILGACRKHGKAAGLMVTTPEEGQALVERGFRCLLYWGDIWLYQRALETGIKALRERIGGRGDGTMRRSRES